NNIDAIARAIALTLAEYFGQPLFEPIPPKAATVATAGGNLNLRSRPNTMAAVIGTVPNGAQVTVYGLIPDWASIQYNGKPGFVAERYLNIR
ncbi:MAG: SH3 domain-containing protein, partial [Oscillospiraceae bacterium]|nr:SH3 domain-containing protein [Oscillospiraceae bacterium]